MSRTRSSVSSGRPPALNTTEAPYPVLSAIYTEKRISKFTILCSLGMSCTTTELMCFQTLKSSCSR